MTWERVDSVTRRTTIVFRYPTDCSITPVSRNERVGPNVSWVALEIFRGGTCCNRDEMRQGLENGACPSFLCLPGFVTVFSEQAAVTQGYPGNVCTV